MNKSVIDQVAQDIAEKKCTSISASFASDLIQQIRVEKEKIASLQARIEQYEREDDHEAMDCYLKHERLEKLGAENAHMWNALQYVTEDGHTDCNICRTNEEHCKTVLAQVRESEKLAERVKKLEGVATAAREFRGHFIANGLDWKTSVKFLNALDELDAQKESPQEAARRHQELSKVLDGENPEDKNFYGTEKAQKGTQ